ncbi:MAG: hypothetical protein EOL89_02555 [Actinobacteria bacterium]|nr:hypothetical protein [Actinomycetota bacterium]
MMGGMTSQPPLPLAPVAGVRIGQVVDLVEDATGGRVYIRGELVFAWDAGDGTGRRVAATQLARIKAATGVAIADGFGITRETLRRWMRDLETEGTGGLVAGKRGPKGPSKLTTAMIDEIRRLRAQGKTLATIGRQVGVSTDTVRRALALTPTDEAAEDTTVDTTEDAAEDATVAAADVTEPDTTGGVAPLPVLAAPVPRGAGRALAGREGPAVPVFTACASAPRAGLFTALPGIAHSGLLECAREVFPVVPDGFYGLETMLLEGVLRALAGQPRAEGATRLNPADLGRVLGMDRAPEVATIRRKISQLANLGKGADLQGAIAHHHLTRPSEDALVLYVDGHVRAYQGTRSIAKTHVTRLRFPAPATVETWVSDSRGDPVMVVMAEPAASLASELRSLLPDLRKAVGDDRRVLVGFDRGGWSPTLFRDMFAAGFDSLRACQFLCVRGARLFS